MNNNREALPKVIKIIAWLWIAGAILKLFGTYFSWYTFEMWRNTFLILVKLLALFSGILLLKGLKVGAIIYFIATVINTVVFYVKPPDIEGIEIYFSPTAIVTALIIPIVFLSIIACYWKRLR